MTWIPKPSLKTRITLAVSCLIVVIISILSLITMAFFQNEIKRNVSDQQFTLVSTLAAEIDDKFAAAQEQLAVMAKELPRDFSRAREHLDKRRDSRLVFDNGIALVSASGRLLAMSPAEPEGYGNDLSTRKYFRKTMESRKPYISNPFSSHREHHHPVVNLTVPILDHKGDIEAILVGSIDLTRQNFLGKLARTKVGKKGYLYLFTAQRTMVIHPDASRIMKKDVPAGANPLFDKAVAGFEGSGETVNSRGLPMLSAFKRLRTTGWILAANTPLTEAYGAIGHAQGFFLTALVVSVFLSLTMVFIILNYLTVPLARFTDHVREIGQMSGRERFFSYDEADEIGILSAYFNRMIETIDQEKAVISHSEALLAESQRMAHVGNWELDLGTGRVTWSGGMYGITGLAPETFSGTSEEFFGLVHPAERSMVQQAAVAALRGEEKFVVEHRFVRPDGTARTVHSEAEVFWDEKGNPYRMFGTLQDISERKKTEAVLRESEERFRQISEHSKEVFFVVSSDLAQTIYINPAYETLWQMSCQSLYERPLSFTEVIHQDDRPRIFVALEQLVSGGIFDQTYRIVRPDRTMCWIHARTSPVCAENGEVYRYVGIAEDVTRQKLTEERIRKLEQAVEQSPVSIVITDLAGNIEYVNPKFTQLTGYSFPEAFGQNPRLLKSGAMSDEIYRQMWQDIAAGGEWHGEILNRKKSGALFWELASLSAIKNADGAITHYLGVKEDISARKEVDEELAKAHAQLKSTHVQLLQQEKMASIGQLAAGVAHEINNPIGFVASNLNTLKKYLAKLTDFAAFQGEKIAQHAPPEVVLEMARLKKSLKLDYIAEDAQQVIAESLEGADRVSKIVQNLKTFSRLDEADIKLVNINECIESSLNIAWNELESKASVKKDLGDIPSIQCNPQQLNQVFLNLLINAAQAIDGYGEVEVSSRHENGVILVTVADTGCGIPEANRNRVFEPFFTTKEVGKGTGLGLSICYDIIKNHNGEIRIESEVGTGTVFSVQLPVTARISE